MLVSYFALLTVLVTGCLAANTRVLNGKPATPHQFPYHVGIYWKRLVEPTSELKYFSGGALISDTWILTAASSIYLEIDHTHLFVKAGKHIVDEEEASEQTRLVVRYSIHPEYKSVSDHDLIPENDIAMIKVNTPFIFNDYVRAAVLSSASAHFESGSLAGWGATTSPAGHVANFPEELLYTKYLPVIGSKACADAIHISLITSYPVFISSKQICSGLIGDSSGACFRDGGDAFVNKIGNKYVVIGIVSWTHRFCGWSSTVPTVYTRVSEYTGWIKEVIKFS